jgi:deoxyribodipyrimidine photo-lyase
LQAYSPTRAAALARAQRIRPDAYARTRNHLDGAVTGLSPYLTHGVLTLPELLAQVLERHALPVQHKLVFELGWREYFRHVWRHVGDGILESLHPGPLPEGCHAPEVPADIRSASTGVPVIDQAVRTLYATGTLHNHARMWLASYVVHVRRVHWRAGADWLVAHLLDGDLASNHLSWQWVAGTASHKPYLFNADNVARYAPEIWHSPGTVIDQPYVALDAMARCATPLAAATADLPAGTPRHPSVAEPLLHHQPPPALGVVAPDVQTLAQLAGRAVWLVLPWALRPPPPDMPSDVLVLGVYLHEHHRQWPWPLARWQWVDTAMAQLTQQRWSTDAAGLATALVGAASVRSVDDPHATRWLEGIAQLDPAPALFPLVEQPCRSFSHWWTRATRGIARAEELL